MNKKRIPCDRKIHRNLKIFCSVHEIETLDKGIERLLNIAYN